MNLKKSLIKNKLDLADDFYKKAIGINDIDGHLRGIDFDNPISKVTKPKESVMYQLVKMKPDKTPSYGDYFFDNPLEDVSKLGVGDLNKLATDERVMIKVVLDEDIEFLKSTSANIPDWTLGSTNIFEGGATQFFNSTARYKIKSFEIIKEYK